MRDGDGTPRLICKGALEEVLDVNATAAALAHIGIPAASVQTWLDVPEIAVRVKATAVFEQTPGPDAGKAIA